MKRVALFAFALILSLVAISQAGTGPRTAIGVVLHGDGVCTGEAIRPNLLMTASHCVGSVGSPVSFYTRVGVAKREYQGIVVWDSPRWNVQHKDSLDLSFVRLAHPMPAYLKFARTIPTPQTPALSISMAAGFEYWTKPLLVEGLFHDTDLGWVLVYRGDTYPGASGSVVLVNGEIVGMITHGLGEQPDPFVLVGATAGRILQAVRDYDKYGPMQDQQEE